VHVIASQIGSRFGTAARPTFSHREEEKSAGKQPIESDDRRTADM